MRYDLTLDYARQYRKAEGVLGLISRAFIELYERAVEPPPSLTLRQREIYEFIKRSIVERGVSPTMQEIGDHFGYRASSTVHEHISSLERKGYIVRNAKESRGIRILEQPQPSSQEPG